ncbi:MAG: rod shape-determining protein RodA [Deltaproteobacteria bacterium]|nr:rod shape-determining protein RodA [Deltaproteobacteria bacterium]
MPAIDRRLIQNFEWPLVGLLLALSLIGVVNLISAAPETADWFPATAKRQFYMLALGLLCLLISLVPDYRSLERYAIPIYLLCVALLVAVLVVGPVINGSQRWIVAGPLRLQPSEPLKLGLAILFARLLARQDTRSELGLLELVKPALLFAIPAVLVLRQPDLGTTMLLALLAGTFLLVARVRLSTLLWLGAAGIAGVSVAWFFYLHDYQKERVLTFLSPERDPLGTAYHAIQSQIAVGSGGFLGKGFRRGPQSQLDFVPEQQTDFVFSVLAEEWGFVGAAFMMLLYLGFIVRGLMIARASKDLFGAYLGVGVCAIFFWGGFINIGMVLGVLPVVGVPLPLLSYGGSSLLTCVIGTGLLMNISMRRYIF